MKRAAVLFVLLVPRRPPTPRSTGRPHRDRARSLGAVVPGASVSATHSATNVVTLVRTTDDGAYLVPNLLPGAYVVACEAPASTGWPAW